MLSNFPEKNGSPLSNKTQHPQKTQNYQKCFHFLDQVPPPSPLSPVEFGSMDQTSRATIDFLLCKQ